ncbi:MAG: hypothetical protein FVQ83_08445 [Chloroflexi bacterium]|nr:hypothetical protein [Chloroflexota bacterium]
MWPVMSNWQPMVYTALIDKAVQTLDQDERLLLYHQAEEMLVENVPIIPILYPRTHNLVKPWLKKVPVGSFWIFFKDVFLEKH